VEKEVGYYMEEFNNINIIGERFDNLKKTILKEIGKETKQIIKVRNNRQIYKILLNTNINIRLDIGSIPEVDRLQQIAIDNNINIPKIIKIIKIKNKFYKFSEWIDGDLLYHVWNTKEVFYKSGELMAKLNLVKDLKTNKYLNNTEFSSTNALWTPDKEIYIIDHGKLRTTDNIDGSLMPVLLKRIRNKERIEIFLSGYSKYRDTNKIIEELNKRNWQWPNKPLQKRGPLQ
jgi:hypothetical protein